MPNNWSLRGHDMVFFISLVITNNNNDKQIPTIDKTNNLATLRSILVDSNSS